MFKKKQKPPMVNNNAVEELKSTKQILRTTVKNENNSLEDATSVFDKLRLAFMYRDKVTGKRDARRLIEERKENDEYQSLYSTIKKELLVELDKFEKLGMSEAKYLEIQVDAKFSKVIYQVLTSSEFESYSWVERDVNDDLIILGAEVPRIFVFSVKYISRGDEVV